MSPRLKVIAGLQLGPWNFRKLQIDPFLLPPACLLALFFSAAAVQCRRPPWRASPATSCFALAPTRRSQPSPPPVASRWCSLHSATRPRRGQQPPPRRRGGELAAEPAALSSRTHEHYKYPSIPFCLLFRLLPTPTPQNTVAAPQNTSEPRPTVDPPHRSSSACADPAISTA